jgi:EAL domain-containing protein (putative c-di-GMP-specific phosphodiesterase class I)
MYRAKAAGPGNWRIFDPGWAGDETPPPESPERVREAVDRGELVLHYQPQVSALDGRIVGVEALLRWNHPERGLLSPPVFLPAVTDPALLFSVCAWVLRSACAQARAWDAAGLPAVRLAVNLSARELTLAMLPEYLRGVLEQTGLPADRLELEVTEDAALFQERQESLSILGRLRDLGVRIAIDDFGTGPTSLTFLTRFPIHTLKVGISLVRLLPDDPDSAAIVRMILHLAHTLKIERVVAEGVERDAQLAFLRSLGCSVVQGFAVGRPMTAQELAGRLRG